MMNSLICQLLIWSLLTLLPSLASADSTLYFIHNDHLATPQVMTDQNQADVWEAQYEPFGKVNVITQAVENKIRFPGQYFDSETGLNYNWNRYYDTDRGRYITSDRIGLDGESTHIFIHWRTQFVMMIQMLICPVSNLIIHVGKHVISKGGKIFLNHQFLVR